MLSETSEAYEAEQIQGGWEVQEETIQPGVKELK